MDVCISEGLNHLSDYGSEQNVLLPLDARRQICKLHCLLNIHTYLTDVNESYFEVGGRRFNAINSMRALEGRFPVEMGNFATIFRHTDKLL